MPRIIAIDDCCERKDCDATYTRVGACCSSDIEDAEGAVERITEVVESAEEDLVRMASSQMVEDFKRMARVSHQADICDAQMAARYLTKLPEWAYHPDVAALADGKFNTQMVPLAYCIGPAVKLAKWALAASWFSFLCITYIGSRSTECTTEDGKMAAVMPTHLWLLWVPSFIFCFYVEIKCVRLSTLPYIQVVGRYKFSGIKVPFSLWLPLTLMLSFLQRSDMASDGFSINTMMGNLHCDSRLDELFKTTVRNSIVYKWMPQIADIPFDFYVEVSFVFVFVQVLYTVVMTTPGANEFVDYEHASDPDTDCRLIYADIPTQGPGVHFKNVLGEETNLGAAIMILGETTGMCTISKLKPSYPETRVFILLRNCISVKRADLKRVLSIARNSMAEGIAVIGAVAFCESSIQINVQVEFFALRRSLSHDSIWQWHWISGMMSIALSLMTCIEKASEAREIIQFAGRVLDAVEIVPRCEETPGESAESDWDEDHDVKTLRRNRRILIACVIILLLSTSYAMTKCVAAFICESSIWSLKGCIPYSELGISRHSK